MEAHSAHICLAGLAPFEFVGCGDNTRQLESSLLQGRRRNRDASILDVIQSDEQAKLKRPTLMSSPEGREGAGANNCAHYYWGAKSFHVASDRRRR